LSLPISLASRGRRGNRILTFAGLGMLMVAAWNVVASIGKRGL
jgi:hypothetical protein